MATTGRIGGLLIVAACGLWVLAGAIRGDISPRGRDLHGLGDLMTAVSLALGAGGTIVLSITGPRPFDDARVRLGLGIFAFALTAYAASPLIPIPAGTDPLESWPYILSVGLGLAGMAVGLLLTAVGLVTSNRAGRSR